MGAEACRPRRKLLARRDVRPSNCAGIQAHRAVPMIQAVILAGGLGTRMLPYTETVPKPMLPVRGRPFIEHQLQLLRSAGVRRFLLLIGYLGEQIECFAGNGERYGVEIEYSHEASPLG